MADLPPARAVRRPPLRRVAHDCVPLAHHERVLRRRRLVTVHDEGFLVDLPATLRVEHGDAFDLGDGRLIEVIAAEEPLIEARVPGVDDDRAEGRPAGRPSLARLAWHVGNRHAPCQVEPGRLLVLRDHVMRAMLLGLGAAVEDVSEPFHPEGGAYEATTGHAHAAGRGDLAGLAHDPL